MTNKNAGKNIPIEPFVRRHRPFFVALFVLIPTLAIPALLYFTVIKSDAFHKWHTLHVVYENSQGLKKGSQVSMSGTAVGHVRRVDLIKEKVVNVDFNVNSRYIHLVSKDTKARMKQRGFMGDWEIELYGGSAEAGAAAEGDTLGADRLASIDEIIEGAIVVFDTAVALLSDVASLVKGMEAGEGTMGQLLKNDTLYRYIDAIGANVVSLSGTANVMARDARALIGGVGETMGDARNAIRNADSLINTVSNVTKTAGASTAAILDTMQILVNSVNKSFENIDAILKNMRTVSETSPELVDKLNKELDEVGVLLKALQRNWFIKRHIRKVKKQEAKESQESQEEED